MGPRKKGVTTQTTATASVRRREGAHKRVSGAAARVSTGQPTVGSAAAGSGGPLEGVAEHTPPIGRSSGNPSPKTASGNSTLELPTPVDFAILTAIEVERKAVCAAFGLTSGHRVRKDGRVYWRGQLPLSDGGFYEVVVAQSSDMANIDSALLTNDMLHHWRPGAALLVGIAASARDNVKLGDVVVASDVYYYERGKATPQGKKPEPKILPADATLWANVTALPDWDGKLSVGRPERKRSISRIHHGVVASGEKVIADVSARDEIGSGHRKITAIAMEEYGFSRAIWQSFQQVRHLVIRGICDDGSPSKNDRWHAYAAAAAAAFTRHFLLDRPIDPRTGGGAQRP